MSVSSPKEYAKQHDLWVTFILSFLGYAVVIGTFAGAFPYPDLSFGTVQVLTHLIAVVNTTALVLILYGWWQIRSGNVRKHRRAMISSFGLILVFLVMYLLKVGGGETKRFDINAVQDPLISLEVVRNFIYFPMLGVHLLLSILAVPVVIYAVVLGLTHSTKELREQTPHKKVGRIAAGSWSLSLFLGVITYFMLNHIYGWTI